MPEALLTTQNLTIGYDPNTPLFNNLDLSLYKGQLVCFMGPNGIGKSTLMRTLAGIQKQMAGKIKGTGSKNVTVVLTDRINTGMMTVRELISYGRYPYLGWTIRPSEKDYEIINSAIDQVHVEHLLDKPIHELSDGQMQLVMIARALAQDTPVMLLDEPTAHLDLNNRVEIMNLLRKLAHKFAKAILVSTHELDLALQTADLIWLTTAEKSIRTGIPEDLVLDGSFDEVFKFKGFDLKTGKVKHESYRKISIALKGEGPAYLWTKNALERNGYDISDNADFIIALDQRTPMQWKVTGNGTSSVCNTIEAVLRKLE